MSSEMARFVIRRLGSMVAVLFAVSVIVFLIFTVLPGGDPAVQRAGQPAQGAAHLRSVHRQRRR